MIFALRTLLAREDFNFETRHSEFSRSWSCLVLCSMSPCASGSQLGQSMREMGPLASCAALECIYCCRGALKNSSLVERTMLWRSKSLRRQSCARSVELYLNPACSMNHHVGLIVTCASFTFTVVRSHRTSHGTVLGGYHIKVRGAVRAVSWIESDFVFFGKVRKLIDASSSLFFNA